MTVAAIAERRSRATLVGRVGGERHAGRLRCSLRRGEQPRFRRSARVLDELVTVGVLRRLHGGGWRARRRRVRQLAVGFQFRSFSTASSFAV